ncbi:hypothetical protein [Streptomyces sp. 2P-4]|uniref:hypothetical protein n=1 Tax=Streptomyces sp. 2P-4 TaxID=2931974 RepID=UPI00253FB80D|nr:hypothetical protein [Streptomyces sp. 2P-4]
MTTTVLVLAAVLCGVALVALAAVLERRSRPGRTAGFRVGPLWAWCPAERALMPHRVDAGSRRCISCKTSTPTNHLMEG